MTSNDKPIFLAPEKVRAIVTLTDQADRQGVVYISPGYNGEMVAHAPNEVDGWTVIPPHTFITTVPHFFAYKLISTWLTEGTGWKDATRNAMVPQGLIRKFQGIEKKGATKNPLPKETQRLMDLFGGDNRALLEDMRRLFDTEPEKQITRLWTQNHRSQREALAAAHSSRVVAER